MPEADTTDAPADEDVDQLDPPEKAGPKETDWKARARQWEDRAKANQNAAKDLEELRKRTETETEKAVRTARDEGRNEALKEVGTARAEDAIRFSIGDRLPDKELDELLGDLNLARFMKDDGSVDREKVASYVARIAPQGKGKPDLGQGPRGVTKGGAGSFLTDAIRNRQR